MLIRSIQPIDKTLIITKLPGFDKLKLQPIDDTDGIGSVALSQSKFSSGGYFNPLKRSQRMVCYVQIRTHAEIESDDGVPTEY